MFSNLGRKLNRIAHRRPIYKQIGQPITISWGLSSIHSSNSGELIWIQYVASCSSVFLLLVDGRTCSLNLL
ncbi:hypothetical protein RchiOBHm_Chr6g0247641 [Rosa chinensis]|uniref:Uncharacterized protein n=1 Tax=Rosa chinensis TaxID=74649 RepID=A0A2P6PJU8_ROSCH|nr:hypothetical protein RchiOBHm_Chr6g0247641 [Rosa chinensis]